MNDTLRGAAKSKVIWLNTILTLIGGLELLGNHVTTILGPKWGAGAVLLGGLSNLYLRVRTTQALSEK